MSLPSARVLAGMVVASVALATRARGVSPSIDLVEISVVASDRHGHVTGLQQSDFEVKEDGHRVDVKTFSEVRAAAAAPGDPGRAVVLLLDDVGVAPAGSEAVRALAEEVLRRVDANDAVAVVRLQSDDEPYGDVRLAVSRILEYRAAGRFADTATPGQTLKRIAAIVGQMEALDQRRKLVVCIGSIGVCDIDQPSSPRSSWFRPAWNEAVAASARANVTLYALTIGRLIVRRPGITAATGGEALAIPADYPGAIDQIWREASDYYVLGYWPSGSSRELHDIDVKVTKRGVHVRARQKRGD